jgi:hypothetical protein
MSETVPEALRVRKLGTGILAEGDPRARMNVTYDAGMFDKGDFTQGPVGASR